MSQSAGEHDAFYNAIADQMPKEGGEGLKAVDPLTILATIKMLTPIALRTVILFFPRTRDTLQPILDWLEGTGPKPA